MLAGRILSKIGGKAVTPLSMCAKNLVFFSETTVYLVRFIHATGFICSVIKS